MKNTISSLGCTLDCTSINRTWNNSAIISNYKRTKSSLISLLSIEIHSKSSGSISNSISTILKSAEFYSGAYMFAKSIKNTFGSLSAVGLTFTSKNNFSVRNLKSSLFSLKMLWKKYFSMMA